jgi:hypothetical protein
LWATCVSIIFNRTARISAHPQQTPSPRAPWVWVSARPLGPVPWRVGCGPPSFCPGINLGTSTTLSSANSRNQRKEEGGEKSSSNCRIELGGTRWTSPRHPGRIAEDIPGRQSDLGGRISCWGCFSAVRSIRGVGSSTNVPTLGK